MAKDTTMSQHEGQRNLCSGFQALYYVDKIREGIPYEHIASTPFRSAEAIMGLFEGCFQNPREFLEVTFDETHYDEMIYVNDISFVSVCAHHTLPFLGKLHFAYIPDGKIVGLSKIPRFIETLAHRPQIQEKLTCEIVDTFDNMVSPKGCAVIIEAYHLCMMIRGVECQQGYTKTTALRGIFKTNETTKQEFLHGVTKVTKQIWP